MSNLGGCVWLTGMSGAGKSTLALGLATRLRAAGREAEILDGDSVRATLSKGLGFTQADREENILRVGWVCGLLARHNVISIAALISPIRAARESVRASMERFVEVHVDCPLEVLVRRDVKGLYREALAGRVAHFTGISDPYEPPIQPDVRVDSSVETAEESLDRIWAAVQTSGMVPKLEREFAIEYSI